jgi:hypothetical protein
MILTTHALAGAAIGKYISNPWLIVIFSLIIHFCLDTFRHGEYLNRKSTFANTWWKVALDLLIGLGITLAYLLYFHPAKQVTQNILLGTFFSMFPDFLTVLYWKLNFKFLKKIYDFHGWTHPYPKDDPRYEWNLRNMRNDVLFSILAIILLLI